MKRSKRTGKWRYVFAMMRMHGIGKREALRWWARGKDGRAAMRYIRNARLQLATNVPPPLPPPTSNTV